MTNDKIIPMKKAWRDREAQEIRRVRRLTRQTPLVEPKASFSTKVLAWCGAGCLAILLIAVFSGTAHAEQYTDEQIVNAIRKAEGNWNYGIKSVKCETSAECRKICFNTVKRNRQRFAEYGHKNHADFISFLADRYCPIGASNDPKGLNANWQRNVRYFLAKDK